jgi:hypothetical protein
MRGRVRQPTREFRGAMQDVRNAARAADGSAVIFLVARIWFSYARNSTRRESRNASSSRQRIFSTTMSAIPVTQEI